MLCVSSWLHIRSNLVYEVGIYYVYANNTSLCVVLNDRPVTVLFVINYVMAWNKKKCPRGNAMMLSFKNNNGTIHLPLRAKRKVLKNVFVSMSHGTVFEAKKSDLTQCLYGNSETLFLLHPKCRDRFVLLY